MLNLEPTKTFCEHFKGKVITLAPILPLSDICICLLEFCWKFADVCQKTATYWPVYFFQHTMSISHTSACYWLSFIWARRQSHNTDRFWCQQYAFWCPAINSLTPTVQATKVWQFTTYVECRYTVYQRVITKTRRLP